jgi:hypothetical protein
MSTTRHTLPSGLEVELGDYHQLLGDDLQEIWDSLTEDGTAGVGQLRRGLAAKLIVGTSDLEKWPVPFTPAQVGRLPIGDYYELVVELIKPAYELANGRSVKPVVDDFADPTPPTTPSTE